MMINIRLSIIVPYYNVKQYINCLHNSIFNQLTDEIEMILVEDFSTDGTREYLSDLHSKNSKSNIKFFFHNENKGLSEARNTGLKHAEGKYVWFVDSDDVLVDNCLERLLDTIDKTDSAMIFFDFYFLYEESLCLKDKKTIRVKKHHHSFLANHLYSKGFFLESYFKNAKIYAWMFIAKKELYNEIEFPNQQYYEDISTIPKIVHKSPSYYYINDAMLYYRQRQNSIMGNPSLQNCLDYSLAMKSSVGYCEKNGISQNAKQEMYLFYFKTLRWALNDMQDHDLIEICSYQKYIQNVHLFYKILPYKKNSFLAMIFKKESTSVFLSSLFFMITPKLYLFIRKIQNK